MREREHILSLTKKDFEIQTFRSGGKGGQHQNTTDSGVRIIHRESGARGESRENKSQKDNKKAAFQRLVSSSKFQKWLTKKINNLEKVEEEVDRLMKDEYIKLEVKDEKGRWVEVDKIDNDETESES